MSASSINNGHHILSCMLTYTLFIFVFSITAFYVSLFSMRNIFSIIEVVINKASKIVNELRFPNV